MLEPRRSDRSLEGPVTTGDRISVPRSRSSESGQATTEFALILLPLLLLVAGIIQFGIGLQYWLDMNRIANQGARWAVVDAWPNCIRTFAGACTATTLGAGNSLETYLESQALTQGLQSSVTVSVCYPDDGDPALPGALGTPVRVRLQSPYSFSPIVELGTITLRADTTMRIENKTLPTQHLSAAACP